MSQRSGQLRIVLGSGKKVLQLDVSGLARKEIQKDITVVGHTSVIDVRTLKVSFCVDIERIGAESRRHPLGRKELQGQIGSGLEIGRAIYIGSDQQTIGYLCNLGNIVCRIIHIRISKHLHLPALEIIAQIQLRRLLRPQMHVALLICCRIHHAHIRIKLRIGRTSDSARERQRKILILSQTQST